MLWWIPIAFAGRAETIQGMLDTARVEMAQRKCERFSAFLPETEPELREVCAAAMYPKAVATDTFKDWVRFQADWKGTSFESKARAGEAAARLRDLGPLASETEYRAFLNTYADTPSTERAEQLLAEAAVRSIASADDAKRVARDHPEAAGLEAALRPWFADFVTVSVKAGVPSAVVDPPLAFPGKTLEVEWAGRQVDTAVPWDVVAHRHLEGQGMSSATARLLLGERESFPPCTLPDATVGVRVRLGSLETFAPHPVSCGGKSPAFVSVRDGSVVGLALRPGPGLRFAGADGSSHVRWGRGPDAVNVPLLGPADRAVIPLGTVVGQQVGPGHLLHPLAGGLPWYVVEGPPPTAQPIATGTRPTPIDGLVSDAPGGGKQVEKVNDASWTRTLPDGQVQVLSPLYQELTGLHDGNAAFARRAAPALPAGFWPSGAEPIAVNGTRREEVKGLLARFGIQLTRAWQLQLHADPKLEVPFEGVFAGRAVRGVLDPRESDDTWRLFVIEAPSTRDTPVVFRESVRTHFAWIGSGRPEMQVFRIDARGLIHLRLLP